MTMQEIFEVRGKLEKMLESDRYDDMMFAFNKLQELGNLVHVDRETSSTVDNNTANYYFQQLKREVNARTSQKSNDDARDVWLALKYGIVR
jgi:hypothetical protein